MDKFLSAAIKAIDRQGGSGIYTSVTASVYNIETKKTTNTNTDYTIKMYKRHVRATQYDYPSLIGKDAAIFYIANYQLGFTPKNNDKITMLGDTYTIEAVYEHMAKGQVALYRLLAIKG